MSNTAICDNSISSASPTGQLSTTTSRKFAGSPITIPGLPGQEPINVIPFPSRIFVGGINANTTEDELKNFFSQFGRIENCKVIADRTGTSKGYGFVTFDDTADATRLITMANNGETFIFKDRKLNIDRAYRKVNRPMTDQPYGTPFWLVYNPYQTGTMPTSGTAMYVPYPGTATALPGATAFGQATHATATGSPLTITAPAGAAITPGVTGDYLTAAQQTAYVPLPLANSTPLFLSQPIPYAYSPQSFISASPALPQLSSPACDQQPTRSGSTSTPRTTTGTPTQPIQNSQASLPYANAAGSFAPTPFLNYSPFSSSSMMYLSGQSLMSQEAAMGFHSPAAFGIATAGPAGDMAGPLPGHLTAPDTLPPPQAAHPVVSTTFSGIPLPPATVSVTNTTQCPPPNLDDDTVRRMLAFNP